MSLDTQDENAHTWTHWTEPSWLDVDGLRTAYRRKGQGAPLLYLHGGGLTRMWLPFHEELSRHFDTIVPEHPGFGDTPMPETLRGFSDLVLHYDTVVRELEIEGAHLVGHSIGGWLAAKLAIFYPQRFASLTLVSPMGVRVQGEPIADCFRWSAEQAADVLLNGAAGKHLDILDLGDPIEQTLHQYAESITLARLLWNPRYDIRFDWRLQRIATPTLVLHPADDRLVPRSHSQRFAALIPNARFELLEGVDDEPASHLAIVQQPERIVARIAEHVASVAPGHAGRPSRAT